MILVSRPNYDPATRYLYHWSQELIDEASKKGMTVIDLSGPKAGRSELEGRLNKVAPRFVMLNGHGNASCVTGQDSVALVHADENAQILEGLITYAVSCESAVKLGRLVGSFPLTAYIGFMEKFVILQTHRYLNNPVADPLAKPFMEFSREVWRNLLKGRGASESVERAKVVGIASVHSLLTSASDPDAQAAAKYLWWNTRNLVCWGDGMKRIT